LVPGTAAPVVAAFKGGDKLAAKLKEISDRVAAAKGIRVGFLEGATYEDGTSLPVVAAVQEFGGTIKVEAHQVDIYRKLSADGDFLRGGRFVKQSQSNFQTTHDVAEYTVTIPARPYFRPMVAEHKAEWPEQLGKLLKAADYDANTALMQMGEVIAGELRASILAVTAPALAASTVKAKGSDKPLVASGHMLNSVDYEITD
jgi:hypothetical protein